MPKGLYQSALDHAIKVEKVKNQNRQGNGPEGVSMGTMGQVKQHNQRNKDALEEAKKAMGLR